MSSQAEIAEHVTCSFTLFWPTHHGVILWKVCLSCASRCLRSLPHYIWSSSPWHPHPVTTMIINIIVLFSSEKKMLQVGREFEIPGFLEVSFLDSFFSSFYSEPVKRQNVLSSHFSLTPVTPFHSQEQGERTRSCAWESLLPSSFWQANSLEGLHNTIFTSLPLTSSRLASHLSLSFASLWFLTCSLLTSYIRPSLVTGEEKTKKRETPSPRSREQSERQRNREPDQVTNTQSFSLVVPRPAESSPLCEPTGSSCSLLTLLLRDCHRRFVSVEIWVKDLSPSGVENENTVCVTQLISFLGSNNFSCDTTSFKQSTASSRRTQHHLKTMDDYYKVLEISKSATQVDVKKA